MDVRSTRNVKQVRPALTNWQAMKAAFSKARDWEQLPVHDGGEYSTEVLSRKPIVGDAA
jgi:hypothetical protein